VPNSSRSSTGISAIHSHCQCNWISITFSG